MKRDRLQDVMARRSPLASREPVAPIDLYAVDDLSRLENEEVNKAAPQQSDKHYSGQADIEESPFADLLTTKQTDRKEVPRRRYTTYLKPETIKAIKWLAVDEDRNDYEIVQEALDEYLSRSKQ